MSQLTSSAAPPELYLQIRSILQSARQQSYRAVNTAMVEAYWQIGRRIVEHEQGGDARAAYGQNLLLELSAQLTEDFGKGFSVANLRNFRQFYLAFNAEQIRYTLCSDLTWSHYRQLMRIENLEARNWYAAEASQQGWSARLANCFNPLVSENAFPPLQKGGEGGFAFHGLAQ